jgi:hypothetical protein
VKFVKYLGICLCAAGLLSACAVTPIPIDNLTYRGTATTRSDKSARILIESSGVGGTSSTTLMPAGGVFVPIANRSSVMPFGPKDQSELLQSLQKELVRLGIVRTVSTSASGSADVNVNIRIDSALFSVDQVEYTLEMTMLLSGAGASSVQRKYRVVSTEKDSTWEKWNTNGAQAREKLAHLVLERLVPDIEAFVGGRLNQ